MDIREQLKQIFTNNYCGYATFCEQVLKPTFGAENYIERKDSNPNWLNQSDIKIFQSITFLGEFELTEGDRLLCFDVTLQPTVKLSANRVTIQKVVRKLLATYSNAFIIFHYPNNEGEWRVSYVSKGKDVSDTTSAKRYTYLFGEGSNTRTAVERFTQLANNNRKLSTNDILAAFSVESLTKQFYKELFDWYQWAQTDDNGFRVTYPNDTSTEEDDRQIAEHLIRLITRLMFVWFIKQKELVPKEIFIVKELRNILVDFDEKSTQNGNYYNAILQNLFFATLNKEINERAFAHDGSAEERKEHYGVKTLFRNPKESKWFKIENKEVLDLFKIVPFLNGGLFECLDKENDKGKVLYYDGFSREAGAQQRAKLPNCLFFDETYGIIPLLERYNFTIEENSPSDIEVALDPELLGKVFENLLGAYNPETKETARKQSGSFYTPREIVNYMVDESLIAYLKNVCPEIDEFEIRNLFSEDDELAQKLTSNKKHCMLLAKALKTAKILDPACGSGAFPMGILNRMVEILKRLHEEGTVSNYNLKLELIENCIYGIDIQTIAVQISKLRFFISLICEQTPSKDVSNNYGIIPLPNLETKFVAANSLIGIKKRDALGMLFTDTSIDKTNNDLRAVRHNHFSAKNADDKSKYRKEDKDLRDRLSELLFKNHMFAPDDAKQLAEWNPYDQNTTSSFFDAEWMFGLDKNVEINAGCFDIVIGNPPYIKESTNKNAFDGFKKSKYYQGKMDLWYGFACIMLDNLKKESGILTFIATNNWVTNAGGSKLRAKIASEAKIKTIIDFTNYKIFESADIQTMIMIFQNIKENAEYIFDYRKITDTQVTIKDVIEILKKEESQKFQFIEPIFKREYFKDKTFVFSNDNDSNILNTIREQGTFFIDGNKELMSGIDVLQDAVNKKSQIILGDSFNVKEGIFVLSSKEIRKMNLSEKEMELIKPYYTTKELTKYYGDKDNSSWIIYTNSSFKDSTKILPYIKIKEHLDKFKPIITSENGTYGLNRPRDEKFFQGEKIMSVRKCAIPSFTYTDYDCYVSRAFFSIKSNRINLKYLTAILNSKLVAFWLKHKGKMQGFQYQVDKDPIINIPIALSQNTSIFESLVEYIIFLKSNLDQRINEYVSNEHIIESFEDVINACVYELYFAEHMREKEIDILKYTNDIFKPIGYTKQLNEKALIINSAYTKLKEPSNEIRNRMMLFATRSENILLPIQKIY